MICLQTPKVSTLQECSCWVDSTMMGGKHPNGLKITHLFQFLYYVYELCNICKARAIISNTVILYIPVKILY